MTAENLKILLNEIQKMKCETQNLEIKSDLVDIIYSIDDKVEVLNQGLIEEFIRENIDAIDKISKENETKKLMEAAQQLDDDDARAFEIQQEILEQLKLKRQLEYRLE